MENIMHCYICDWSPDVDSEYSWIVKPDGCRLVLDDLSGRFVCTDCSDVYNDALSDFGDEEEEDDE